LTKSSVASGKVTPSPALKETGGVTPDGRYLVVRGRLWRRSNPGLPEGERARLVSELMAARRDKGKRHASDTLERRLLLGDVGSKQWAASEQFAFVLTCCQNTGHYEAVPS
jgi:hypothetical protein